MRTARIFRLPRWALVVLLVASLATLVAMLVLPEVPTPARILTGFTGLVFSALFAVDLARAVQGGG